MIVQDGTNIWLCSTAQGDALAGRKIRHFHFWQGEDMAFSIFDKTSSGPD